MKITAKTREDAFDIAKMMLDGAFCFRNIERSQNAGYDIYATENDYEWISDLGDRYEVNQRGESVNIWIDKAKEIREEQLADALNVINDCIYQLDDYVSDIVKDVTSIGQARTLLYGAYKEIRDILDAKFPESDLYAKYNLSEA